MDRKMMLEEAAHYGKLDVLDNLLNANPSILADFKLESLGESLLDIATKSGHLNIVHKLMKIDPDIATELNKDGFRPLDIAVIMGNFGIAKEILRLNEDLCRLKGKDQRTALHYAAVKGRIEVIDELPQSCPNSIEDITIHGETALHLALKNHQFDAFVVLIKWLKTLNKESMINIGDEDGNTILHVAVLTKQHECINLLLAQNSTIKGTIEVNGKNCNGLTPLDLLDIQDSYDIKIKQKLEYADAITSPHSSSTTAEKSLQQAKNLTRVSKPNHDLQSEATKNWFKYFKFQKQRDSPSDTRNALLVVAALIATVCFQAGVNPPNGILDKPPQPNTPNPNFGPPSPPPFYVGPAGVSALSAAAAVFGSHATSFLFLFANSLGLTASTCIIIYLTAGFPFQRELHIALYSMMFTYGFAISAILKDSDTEEKSIAYLFITIAFALPFALRWLPRWGRKAWRHWRKRDVRKATLPIDN